MAKFRKKPVVIEAIQWNGDNSDEIYAFIGEEPFGDFVHDVTIKTLEGVMTASIGDWIIKGVSGEFYPCKPDIFQKTYEGAWDGQTQIPPSVDLPIGLIAASADMIYETLGEILSLMKEAKPNDRSEVDRYWAISITDMEKLVAVFEKYVVGNMGKAG